MFDNLKNHKKYKKMKLGSNKIDNLYTFYKAISNFPFINPIYILRIYSKIKNTCKKNEYNNFF